MLEKLLPDLLVKHGVTGVLIVWLFITNTRLNEVERRMYECYDLWKPKIAHAENTNKNKLVAILPKELKITRAACFYKQTKI